jgi:hypothetical protein
VKEDGVRIDPKSTIGGLPALQLRDFFRRYDFWTLEMMAQRLELTAPQAMRITEELLAQGLIEPGPPEATVTCWQVTPAGNTLALAKATPPVRRDRAEQHLGAFLERVHRLEADSPYAYRVRTVRLFGSMLTDAPYVGDIDLAVKLGPRYADPKVQAQAEDERRRLAWDVGRQFSNVVQEVGWPEIELWRALKARSRVLSLHRVTDDFLLQIPSKGIYVAPSDESGQ